MYPALMHFRGGKGLACLGGVILAFGVHDFLTTLFLESVLLMATRYLPPRADNRLDILSDLPRHRARRLARGRDTRAYNPTHPLQAHRKPGAHQAGQGAEARFPFGIRTASLTASATSNRNFSSALTHLRIRLSLVSRFRDNGGNHSVSRNASATLSFAVHP